MKGKIKSMKDRNIAILRCRESPLVVRMLHDIDSSRESVRDRGTALMMRSQGRFWLELSSAAMSVVTLVLAIVWRDWIETVLGINPDGGSGSLEWLVVGSIVASGIVWWALARRDGHVS